MKSLVKCSLDDITNVKYMYLRHFARYKVGIPDYDVLVTVCQSTYELAQTRSIFEASSTYRGLHPHSSRE